MTKFLIKEMNAQKSDVGKCCLATYIHQLIVIQGKFERMSKCSVGRLLGLENCLKK